MVLRLTKKASDYLGIALENSSNAENKFCDWFCDMVTVDEEEKTCLLVTNAYSNFSILIPMKRITSEADIRDLFKVEIQEYFEYCHLTDLYENYIKLHIETFSFTKTNSRSVLSSMIGLKYCAAANIREGGDIFNQADRFKMNDSLNSYCTKCANLGMGDYTFPKDAIRFEGMKETVPLGGMPSSAKDTSKKQSVPAKEVYQFYVELKDFSPKIWRRFYVSSDMTMEKLAFAIMHMFNMEGGHIYGYEIDMQARLKRKLHKQKGITEEQKKEAKLFFSTFPRIIVESFIDEEMNEIADEFSEFIQGEPAPIRLDAAKTKINKILAFGGDCVFTYDFGDNWEIDLVLEDNDAQTGLSKSELPHIKEGEGLGIIEDCGSIFGLESIVKAFKKKKGKDYEAYKEWLGQDDFDITAFDKEELNSTFKSFIRFMTRTYNEYRDEL
ncbi:MAG: plasmid pRiA4b ORF-3 family protein [Treponema sp.]|nr:plasmid pRiA4b ORF-3 family protein [Treponema sp.]